MDFQELMRLIALESPAAKAALAAYVAAERDEAYAIGFADGEAE